MFDLTRPLLLPIIYLLAGFLASQNPSQIELPLLSDQVAALFMVGIPEKTTSANPDSPPWNNYVLFAHNIDSDEQLRQLTASLSASTNHLAWIAIDQEGGVVSRVLSDPTATLGQPQLNSAEQAFAIAKLRAEHLRKLGITMVLSPVVDQADGRHAGMKNRAFTDRWGELGTAMVAGYQSGGVTPVVKHFPSYGDLPGDVEQSIPHKNLSNEEIEIFRLALAHAPVLMVSPIVIDNIDPDYPAPISPKVIDFIRRELKFSGVLLTDDVQMRAVRRQYDPVEFAVSAIMAGVDMVMFSGSNNSAQKAWQQILERAENDQALQTRITDSYRLIESIKLTY